MDRCSMIRRSKRLLAWIGCAVVALPLTGCIFGPRPRVVQPVPTGVILGAETNARDSDRGGQRYTGFTVPVDAMLYAYDATDDLLVYSGPVVAGDTVRLYPTALTVLGDKDVAQPAPSGAGAVGRLLAEYQVGHTVRAYYAPVGDAGVKRMIGTTQP